MLLERLGDADRRVGNGYLGLRLLLGLLDALLDFADVVEISLSRARSCGRARLCRSVTSSADRVEMLRSVCMRAMRWAAVPARPNMRSKTTRGLISIGSGVVGVRHEIVFM